MRLKRQKRKRVRQNSLMHSEVQCGSVAWSDHRARAARTARNGGRILIDGHGRLNRTQQRARKRGPGPPNWSRSRDDSGFFTVYLCHPRLTQSEEKQCRKKSNFFASRTLVSPISRRRTACDDLFRHWTATG